MLEVINTWSLIGFFSQYWPILMVFMVLVVFYKRSENYSYTSKSEQTFEMEKVDRNRVFVSRFLIGLIVFLFFLFYSDDLKVFFINNL